MFQKKLNLGIFNVWFVENLQPNFLGGIQSVLTNAKRNLLTQETGGKVIQDKMAKKKLHTKKSSPYVCFQCGYKSKMPLPSQEIWKSDGMHTIYVCHDCGGGI